LPVELLYPTSRPSTSHRTGRCDSPVWIFHSRPAADYCGKPSIDPRPFGSTIRGQVTRIRINRVNGQPEELEGLDGRRQPSLGGTSRISREVYVRFCERLGVQFPGPTRPEAGEVEPALWRRRRSHSPAVPRCLRAARYGRARRNLRRTGRVSGWHRSKQTYKRKRSGERCSVSSPTAE
jgi:hypothetical protein